MNQESPSIDTALITQRIQAIESYLSQVQYPYQRVTAHELIAYFDGDAPSGDTITLQDVSENEFLLLHELVELSELKRMGFKISVNLLYSHPLDVEWAHLCALEQELAFAKKRGNTLWIERRLRGLKEWVQEQPRLPENLHEKRASIINAFSLSS